MDEPDTDHRKPERSWQRANEARLRREAQQWAASQETTLYTEEWGSYYVAVTREGRRLILWMLDAAAVNTDWIQSAMDLREPLRLQSSYTQAMILSLLWQPTPKSVFLSGLGGGCLATTLHHHLTRSRFTCVEIAAPVVTAATRYFGFLPDERLSVKISDVRDFLNEDTSEYDLMLLDVFCDQGISPEHATTSDFLTLCCSRLREGGLLAMNLGNRDPAFEDVVNSLCKLFPTVYACRGRGSTTVLFGTGQRPLSPRRQREASIELEQRHDFLFPLSPWVERLEQLQPPPSGHDVDRFDSLNADHEGKS